MKVTLIHNPEAGSEFQRSGEELTRLIESGGHDIRYQSCKRAGWREAMHEPADLIAIAGGDGIVGKAVKEIVGRGVAVAILPMGTANNIARTLDLRGRSLENLIAGWDRAHRVKLDVGVVTGPWGVSCFVEGIGVGAFTETMFRLDARKNVDLAHHQETDKKIDSVLHIMRIRLDGSAPLPLKLDLDGDDLSGEYVMVEALNIRSVGPNLELAPNADPTDGMLDVVLVSQKDKDQLAEYLTSRLAGKPAQPRLPVRRARKMRIECTEMRLHVDDDVWPKHDEQPPTGPTVVEVGIHSEKLEVLFPREPAV